MKTTIETLTKLDKVFNETEKYLTSNVYEDFDEVAESLWNCRNLEADIKEYVGQAIDYSIWAKELNMPEEKLDVEIVVEHDSSSNNDYVYVAVNRQIVGHLEMDACYDEDEKIIEVSFEYSE